MIFAVRVAIACAFLLVGYESVASACSCAPAGSPGDSLVQAVAVFEGQVESSQASDGRIAFRLSIVRKWKGAIDEEEIVMTADTSAACGYPFAEGQTYLVYADTVQPSGAFTTGLCSRTRPMAEAAQDVDALGEGIVSVDPTREDVSAEGATQAHPSRVGCASCSVQRDRSALGAATVLFVLLMVGCRFADSSRAPHRGCRRGHFRRTQ